MEVCFGFLVVNDFDKLVLLKVKEIRGFFNE